MKKAIDLDKFLYFINEFRSESDRAAVILGTAMLDSLLDQVLHKVLRPIPPSKEELLDVNGPLSSFNSRIHLVYRLGLINLEFARALHLLRKIRNAFAHGLLEVSFESGPQKDRVNELIAPLMKNPDFYDIINKIFFNNSLDEPSIAFRIAVAFLCLRLERLCNECSPVNMDNTMPLIPSLDDRE